MKFRLVDTILSYTPDRSILGRKAVSFEEYSLKEAFGEEGRMPDMLLLESFLQLGNWLILLSSDFQKMAMVVKLGRVMFRGSLRLGEVVHMEVTLRQAKEDGFLLSGRGCVQGREIITGQDCLAVPVALEEYFDPADLRVLLSEIHQPE